MVNTMGVEIERKFLIRNDDWKAHVSETHVIKQGYLQSGLEPDQRSSVRIRISNKQAALNIKSVDLVAVRTEYEYAIPLHDAQEMLAKLCGEVMIEKTRFLVPYADHLWEIDVFEGDNAGLTVAEVELAAVDEDFQRPDWLGPEVTHDERYYNISLLRNPYRMWSN